MFHSRHFQNLASPLAIALALSACGSGEGAASTGTAKLATVSSSADAGSSVSTPHAIAMSANAYSPPRLAEQKTAQKSADKSVRPVPVVIDLGMPATAKTQALRKSADSAATGTPLQVGFAREVVQAKTTVMTAQMLSWQNTSTGGSITSLAFQSGGAIGMRIGVLVKNLPSSAVLRFYAADAETAQELSGKEVLETIQRNLDAGDKTEAARTLWGPYLAGQKGVLEIELPLGTDREGVEIAVPGISHFFLDPAGKEALTLDEKASGACNRDVSCATPLPAASNATAYMQFTKNGSTYICTGTLLNDTLNSGTPYFLSAYHCISDQTTASTLLTRWFGRSSGCNNGVLNPNSVVLTGGATLLRTRQPYSTAADLSGTDTSFMRLNKAPPAGALYVGWSADAQTPSSISYSGVHHPAGDLQKISDGKISQYGYVESGSSAFLNASQTNWPMYVVDWTSGVVEGGSSGSALFLNGRSDNPKIIGQLYGGSSSCINPAGKDVYGRFDIAFNGGLNQWLNPSLQPVFRFYNRNTGAHFFTMNASEVAKIQATLPQFSYEGTQFGALSGERSAGLDPVHRFYNRDTGTHFFTIGEDERRLVQATLPQYTYEGIAWYAPATAQAGWVPLYRFYRKNAGTHFYTSSESEKDFVRTSLSAFYTFENVAYFVRQGSGS